MVIITIQAITKETVDSSIIHTKVFIKVMDTANLTAETMDVAEEITMHADAAGVTSEAIIIINTSNTTVMIMIIVLNIMAHHALYAMDTIIPLNTALREKMTLITSWKR